MGNRRSAFLPKILSEMADEASTDNSYISVNGKGDAVIEGNIGILEYSQESIRLSTGHNSVRFNGRELWIKALNPHSAIVSGKIENIEFVGGA